MTGPGDRDALGRRLGGVAHRDDRAVRDQDLGTIGEQRRDVPVRSDAEEADVERRPRRAVVLRRSGRARRRSARRRHPGRRPRRSRPSAWMFAAGMSSASSSASRACFSLRSSSSARRRSARRSTRSARATSRRGRGAGCRAAAARTAEPIDPPVSETWTRLPSADALGESVQESRGDGLSESGGIGADHDPLLDDEFSHASPASRVPRAPSPR